MNFESTFLSQYGALTRAAGVATLAGRTLIALTGSDRASFLHSFCTNDIKQLTAGSGCEAFITSTQGKTLGHVLVFCESDRLVLDTAPGQAETLLAHFQRYVITEDVEFADLSKSITDLLVAGPTAGELLTKLTGQPPPADVLSHARAKLADHAVTIRRVEYASSPSYFLHTASSDTHAVLAALQGAGAAPCAEEVLEAARLEAGVPLFGRDITPDNLPQEIGRDARAISFVKGCYLGQETVARIDALGHVNRLLAGLKFAGDSLPAAGTELLAADKPVGQVTSAAPSPQLQAPLALALLRRSAARPGTVLDSAAGRAEVVALRIVPAAQQP
jgi:folate-binding protein YgfZ